MLVSSLFWAVSSENQGQAVGREKVAGVGRGKIGEEKNERMLGAPDN